MTARDFRTDLAPIKCWDRTTQAIFEREGEPIDDCALQNREELIGLCEFIQERGIRSYLEIGVWTGRLVSALHEMFDFDRVAACDHGWAEQCGLSIHLPGDVQFFRGDSDSADYRRWREALGPIDLVLIDGDHSYRGVRRDFEINREFPHRYLALHDIVGANRQTVGVQRLWEELSEGSKVEIVRPHRELGLDRSSMGIGIWSAAKPG